MQWGFDEMDEHGYRKNVGIILTKDRKDVLVAKRCHKKSAWQFPQGGIDDGETPQHALFRELEEELGLRKDDVTVLAESQQWLSYEIPKEFRRRSSKPICIGQKQKWFLLQLTSDESKICLDLHEKPEFDEWRWEDYWRPIDLIIWFKRDVYEQALKEFEPFMQL